MKIAVTAAQQLLREHRIFLGKGAVNIDRTGQGLPSNATINISDSLELEPYTTFWGQTGTSLVTMGAFSYTHSRLPHEISVGRYTSIAKGLKVMGDMHPHWWASTSPVFYNHKAVANTFMKDLGKNYAPKPFAYNPGQITIGNDVWIGENVTLGHGVTIGDGAIIASNALVTKDVRAYTVVSGLPAKKNRDRFPAETIELLLESQWWDYSPDQIAPYDVSNPESFARSIIEASSELTLYRPEPLTTQHFEAIHV